jgi:endonuclease/exonuclease/phosphatase family metal-dependent hydrolase
MRSFRLASYNLLHGICLDRRGAVDLAHAAAAIAALEADVVTLQEVDRGLERSGGVDQVGALAAELGWRGVFAPALLGSPDRRWRRPPPHGGDAPGYGVGLLSRLPLGTPERLTLPGGGDGARPRAASPQRPGWDREPRVALRVAVEVGGQRVAVTTTHLSYMPWRGIRQLRVAAAHASSGAGPAVLAGDLNLPARPVRGLLPGWRSAGGAPTYPADAPRVQLDHVLVRGPLRVGAVAVPVRTTSDHRPLVAELHLDGQAPA